VCAAIIILEQRSCFMVTKENIAREEYDCLHQYTWI